MLTNQKKRKKTPLCLFFTSILCIAVVIMSLPSLVQGAEEATVEVINPETANVNFTFNIWEISVGYEFTANITATNLVEIDTWQLNVTFDPELIHCLSISLPSDHIFAGGAVVPPPKDINNVAGYVVWGATLLTGTPFSGNGRLCQIGFNVTQEPSEGVLSCPVHIDTESIFDTWLVNSTGVKVPFTPVDGYYEISAEDTTSPEIGNPTQIPPSNNVQPDQTVKVSVNVTDSETGVKNVTLLYTNNTDWFSLTMSYNSTTELYETTIPGYPLNANVTYRILAYDNAENMAENDNSGSYFIYTVIPEFTQTLILIFFLTLTLAVAVFTKITQLKKHKKTFFTT